MRAFDVQTVTDIWGDIPLTEAGQGAANSRRSTMRSRSSTTPSCIAHPRGDARDAAGCSPYGRPIPCSAWTKSAAVQSSPWDKLANSLRARAAMRLSQVDAGEVARPS